MGLALEEVESYPAKPKSAAVEMVVWNSPIGQSK